MMRTDTFLGRLVTALSRDTPAFRPVTAPRKPGWITALLAALSRSTHAFDSSYRSPDRFKTDPPSTDSGVIQREFRETANALGDPAQKPAVIDLPNRNPYFVGREELLSSLGAALAGSEDRPTPRLVALFGMRGIGKTQLALEYAYRHSHEYDSIAWVASSWRAAIERLLRLHEEQRLLLVIDALDELKEPHQREALKALRSAKSADVVVTSRSIQRQALSAVIEVKSFRQEEAESFLLARISHSSKSAVAELAQELQGLPLALELAATYIAQNNLTVNQYLRKYRQLRERLLRAGKTAGPERVARELVASGV